MIHAIRVAIPRVAIQLANSLALRDAIEAWILSAIKDGEALPVVNGCRLAILKPPEEMVP